MVEDNPFVTGSTVQSVVEGTINQIGAGIPKGYSIKGTIDFDLAIVQKSASSGKADIKVVGLGKEVSKEQSHRIKFSISPIDEADEAEKRAKIAEAESKEIEAKLARKFAESAGVPKEFLK